MGEWGDERVWRGVVASLAEGVIVLDPDGAVREVNRAGRRLFGLPVEGLTCGDFLGGTSLVAPDGTTIAWDEAALGAAFVAGRHLDGVVLGVRATDGVVRWVRASSATVVDETGEPSAIVVTVVETGPPPVATVEGRREARADTGRHRAVFAAVPVGQVVLDAEGEPVDANAALHDLLGLPRPGARLSGAALVARLHPDDREAFAEAVRDARAGGPVSVAVDVRVVTVAGETRDVEATAVALPDHPGPREVLVQFVDATDRRAREALLRAEADLDPLTGLQNRRSFERALHAHLAVTARYGPAGALLLLDVDRFKLVNDTHGHVAGDDVLRHVGHLLQGRLRGSDVVGRLGGDEFAVLLPLATAAGAEAVAAAVVHEVRARVGALAKVAWPVTVSVGGAMIGGEPGTAAHVLRRADRALYAAKQGGRDRWELVDDATDPG